LTREKSIEMSKTEELDLYQRALKLSKEKNLDFEQVLDVLRKFKSEEDFTRLLGALSLKQ